MHWIDWLINRVGRMISWLNVLLIVVIVVDVTARYLFSATSAASFEIEWHLFGALILLGASYALQADSHVRVDVFYSRWSTKVKAWVNLLGTLCLLIPFCLVIIYESVPFVFQAWQLAEGSPDPGGLPARFVIKLMIPIGFVLLLLQGISQVFRHLKTLNSNG